MAFLVVGADPDDVCGLVGVGIGMEELEEVGRERRVPPDRKIGGDARGDGLRSEGKLVTTHSISPEQATRTFGGSSLSIRSPGAV